MEGGIFFASGLIIRGAVPQIREKAISLLHILTVAWYNQYSQGIGEDSRHSRKVNPRRGSHSPGVLLCLPALAPTVKPLARIVANYTRSNGQQEIGENFQCTHLLSVARLEKGSTAIIPESDKINKIPEGKENPQNGLRRTWGLCFRLFRLHGKSIFLLHILTVAWYNDFAREPARTMADTQKNTRRDAALRVSILCLLASAVAVKPLAHEVADYARCDRHKETGQNFHGIHPLLLPV